MHQGTSANATVIVVAAGEGTRLRPYTLNRPKCMVELLGEPLLHRQLRVLRDCSKIGRIVVVGGYQSERIQAPGTIPVLNPHYADTNMVYSLFCAEDSMDPGHDLIIAYGDIVYEPRVLNALLASDKPLAITSDRSWLDYWSARMEDPLADAETFRIGDDGRILELGKKPRSLEQIEGQFIGLIRVRADHVTNFRHAWHALDRHATYDGQNRDRMYMTSFLQYLIDQGWYAHAVFTENGWLEVDTVEDLQRYEQMFREGALQRFYDPG